jgi:hypothetical protein
MPTHLRSKKCYNLDCSSLPCVWSEDATLSIGRAYSGGVVIKGTDPADDKLWISGGHNPQVSGGNVMTSEFLHADGTLSAGPALSDIAAKGICAVQLLTSDGTPGNVLFLGGNQGGSQGSADHVSRKKVEMLDINTNTITDHSVMNFGHSLSACTVFFSPKHEGRPVVYVGGGEFNTDYKNELLDYTMTTTWEELPPIGDGITHWLPRALPSPTLDSVYHIYNSKIWELTCTTSECTWSTTSHVLTTGFQRTSGFQAIYIPEKLDNNTIVSCS